MPPIPILKTKLHPPTVSPDILPRKRLAELLDTGRQRLLTLISAPAGYGKSTLASRWLAACDCPSAWLSLDAEDGDPRVFLSYFLAAFQTAFPSAKQKTETLLEAPELPPLSVLACALLNDLDNLDEPFILVLDDYHNIRDGSVHELLRKLLAHPPGRLHLVVLTRRDPPLPISSLRAQGRLTEVRVAELRFTRAETAALMQKVVKRPVDDATAAALEEKTEGWVTALRLAALCARDQKDLDGMVRDLRGDLPYIAEYLVAEVLSKQDPRIAEYMMEISLLDRFCVPLCEAVHLVNAGDGEPSPREFIEWLIKTNLFTIPLDTRNEWFRYHHLFQQLLQHQLKRRRSGADIARLHARASEWFGSEGWIEDAIRHALAAGDVGRAAHWVEMNRHALLNSDEWFVLEKWLALLPESVIHQRPELLLARVWLLYSRFDVARIPAAIAVVEALLPDEAGDQALQGELEFFRGAICYLQNQGSSSLKHLDNASIRVPESWCEIRGHIDIYHGLAKQMQGSQAEAVGALHEALYHEQPPDTIRRTRLQVTLVYIYIISGDLEKAAAVNEELADFASARGYTYAQVWSCYLQGLIHYYRNDLDGAIERFSRAVAGRYVLQVRAACDALAGLALSYQTRRHPDQAHATLQLFREYVANLSHRTHLPLARSCHSRLSIMQQQGQTVRDWIRQGPPPVENMVFWLEVPVVTYCRALLAEGSHESLRYAKTMLGELLQLNEDNHNTLQMIGVMALSAMVNRKQGRVEEALGILERAVTLAAPGAIKRPFVEQGCDMADLLKRLMKRNVALGYIEELLGDCGDDADGIAAAASSAQVAPRMTSHPLLAEALTNREAEVLELLALRLSNKEIAGRLFITPETVKSHVQHVCHKLHAGNRREAVTKARALGVLDHH